MVRRDQYLIYCSTTDRWALLLWGNVWVLKGRKANIHFIRKEEYWTPDITKSMITIFPTPAGQQLWLQKAFLVASAGRRRSPSLPDCHFQSSSAFFSSVPSFSQPASVCPSLSGSSSPLSPRWHICVSTVSGLHRSSRYCYCMFKKKRKKKEKKSSQMPLPVIHRAEAGAKTDLCFRFPAAFTFVLSHPVSSQAKHEHKMAFWSPS